MISKSENVEFKASGEIFPKNGTNTRTLYNHQKLAMKNMDCINKTDSYSTLIVLPTGGGKTYTASMWLLKNAIDNKKKVLWIAHRKMLLDQAAESFQKYAYAEVIPHISSFRYRIISGDQSHDRTINIDPKDNLLIVSKDSIGRNLSSLDKWLKGENEIYLVVDEAHHSTAKTYRKVIDYVKSKVENVKLIGLTATPFRTGENEQGLLAKIYADGVDNGNVVHNKGITYKIDLISLIENRILSKPYFESYNSEEEYGMTIGVDELEHINSLDTLPDNIAEQMANSATRNKLIVETYKKNQERYGQTIVFAVNIVHAIGLSALFNKAGIKAGYIVSDVKDSFTGVRVSREENNRTIEKYKNGELQVLINVNILTEGIDLPKTETVFLARPTVSKVLMTQMVGRALRGVEADGTPEAYIVSFVDNWNERIAWVSPESIFEGDNDFTDSKSEHFKSNVVNISIAKIEEFASILDDAVDTTALENIPFIKRIPVGMYVFSYLEQNGMDHSYQVMVYDSTVQAYKEFMEALPALFESFNATEEYLSDDLLGEMESHCFDTFFCGEMIPPYEKQDVINVLKYYAQYESVPAFYTFDEVDREKLDISVIAKHICDEDMGQRQKTEYINSIWESSDDNLLKMFFGRKLYFIKQLDIEIMKIMYEDDETEGEDNVKHDVKDIKELTLCEIKKLYPEYEKELRDGVFEKSKNKNGEYQCAICGLTNKTKAPFQVDHIIPMNKGGKTVPENLQILCRHCNGTKGDR